jgi:hypothetical protein
MSTDNTIKEYVDVEIRLTVNGQPWHSIQWKKLTPKKFLKLADFIEDINF